MTRTIDLGHHCVPGVLARLGALASLPTSGILAGQAVASALMEELGVGPGVYNDIDIFLAADADKEAELASQAHQVAEAMRLGLPVAALDDYRALQMGEHSDLQILGATEEGPLNLVWCKRQPGKLLNSTTVLYSFDLNAVEVAIDLQTGQLSWTRSFEYFLKTKELQVTSLVTPARTLLRYFKKRDELQAYGKDEFVANLLASWVDYCSPTEPLPLSAKYQRLAERYAPRFSAAFQLDLTGQALRLTEDWVYPDGVEDALAQAAGEGNDADSMTRLVPQMLYGQALTRSAQAKTDLEQALAEFELAGEEAMDVSGGYANVVQMSLDLLGCEYLADHRTGRHFKLVRKTVEEHPNLSGALFGLTLDEQYQCIVDLRRRAKREGEHVFGLVESVALPVDMWNQVHRDAFFERIEREEKTAVLCEALFAPYETNDWLVKELNTARALRVEGGQMGHCVGGYSSAVATERSRILSIRCGSDSSRWSTVELNVDRKGDKTLSVRQHYGKRNQDPHSDNKALLKEYLARECERLGLTLKERKSAWEMPELALD